MSPRRPDPLVRLQLVEEAARLLDEGGVDAVTARRLATAVGASTQAVYTHFDGIEDVVAEVWREGFRRFGAALDEPAVTADPVADLITQGWGYRRFALRNPHLYNAMFGVGLRAVRQGRADDVEAATGTFGSLLVRIERCRDAGRLQVDELLTAGEVVWAISHGHVSLEIGGYFDSAGRDAVVTYSDCLRRCAIGFGDDPLLVETSLRKARRRASKADEN